MSAKKNQLNAATQPLKVAYATSEALPYYKSGGLADVSRSLPDALVERGHDVRIIHPRYGLDDRELRPKVEPELSVPWRNGSITVRAGLHKLRGRAPAVLLQHPAFEVSGSPYEDADARATGRRFALFARTALHYAQRWGADIIHLNDWQLGLLPAYALLDDVPIPTIFAIHNLAYQGVFSPAILDEVDLPRAFFRTENGLEFHGNVSFMKGGLALSNRIVTVSPTYAREIQTPEYGVGFEGLLRFRSRDLFGILNGIDPTLWDPASDMALSQQYDAQSLAKKAALRLQLMQEAGLDPGRPLLVIVSRLAHQKGIDIVLAALPELLDLGVNLFVLGDGDAALERRFHELGARLRTRIAAVARFDDALARRLYASADFFLMPSRYEPCGLGQMIAQRYGSPPIVRATGGLRDTVKDGVTGFVFEGVSVRDLVHAVQRALQVWRGPEWDALRQRCMALDWSWGSSAQQYETAYASARGAAARD